MLFHCVSVTTAKSIGNGFPLAAVITTPTIAANMGKALHFNTFGGNPMSSVVGSAVLDVSLTYNQSLHMYDMHAPISNNYKQPYCQHKLFSLFQSPITKQ